MDSALIADSARVPVVPLPVQDSTPRDTLKAPFAISERPRSPEPRGRQYVWGRAQMLRGGALTLAELVTEAPGVSLVRSGYLMAPTSVSWYGEPGRVRVFQDGIELDAIDPRSGGNLDLATIPLWSLEEVALERAPGELRVHLRTWRVERTTPQTRTDVLTGAENLNLYRGFYGKRFDSGFGLQLAAQQYSTTNRLTGGDGDALAGFLRVGWARGALSVDAVARPEARTRAPTRRYVRGVAPEEGAIGQFEGGERLGYLRVGFRSPEAEGWWGQATAASYAYVERDSAALDSLAPDADSVVHQSQWIAAVGLTRGPLRLSATGRMRAQGGVARVSPLLRAAWVTERLELAASAEQGGADSTSRLDVAARVQPVPWLFAGGGVSRHTPDNGVVQGPERLTSRAEAGLQWRGRWVSAGVVQRSESQVLGFPVFDATYGPETIGTSSGQFLGIGGPIWGPFSLDWRIHDWGDEVMYRPKVESRAELRVETSLRRVLKRETFHLQASAIHDYRSDLRAPDGLGGVELAKGASAFSLLVDIRIGTAHVFFHNRNFTGMPYETVPGYLMPRLVQQYGIRWEFWN